VINFTDGLNIKDMRIRKMKLLKTDEQH